MTLSTTPSPLSFLQDVLPRALKLAWGPSTDPNKIVPPMDQYPSAEEWPDWCRVFSHGAHLVKVAFLGSLPRFKGGKHDSSILDQVDNIRLRCISHYKCLTDWNHEFIRADLVDEGSDKPLIMVWERDLPLTGGKTEKQRGLEIKSGRRCESVDRVSYLTEENFSKFVKSKQAYLLRTADFPLPGPNILQLASVLETHSLSFPMYHVYSTMCYWYADSTFEVLAEIGKAEACKAGESLPQKGIFRLANVDYIAYRGVTRKSLMDSGNGGPDPTRAGEDDPYPRRLAEMEGELVQKYDSKQKKSWSEEELAQLPAVERQAIEKDGWNVAQFLSIIHDMPTHQKLLNDSIAREREVRGLLEKIQSGHEEQEAAAKREAEARECANIEQALAKEEAKWRRKITEASESVERAEQGREQERLRAEQERERADLAERRVDQQRERAEQERERVEQGREQERLRAEKERLRAGLAERQVDQERERAERERERAHLAERQVDQQRERAEQERERVEQGREQERLRAEKERLRADLAERLLDQERERANNLAMEITRLTQHFAS
ncbi:hypothetical protein B0I37DRAFT_446744 [Chaetomium sp. MPI-CAGE-AT-0009]|nr:hypothetical protein B0I37DRAFT_446744 [Chaetomium sp. MPI-CAGE-AT-0009]